MNKTILSMLAIWCACLGSGRAEIKPGDSLQILIRGVPAGEKIKVEGQYVVGKKGTIRVPLADVAVRAAGKTPEALAREIEAVFKAAEIYTHPNIEVVSKGIEAPQGAQVSIGGQVRRSGPVQFRNGMTLLQAIQAAGDITEFGSKKRIYVTRGERRWVVDLRTGKGQNLRLLNGDTVVVDRRKAFERE